METNLGLSELPEEDPDSPQLWQSSHAAKSPPTQADKNYVTSPSSRSGRLSPSLPHTRHAQPPHLRSSRARPASDGGNSLYAKTRHWTLDDQTDRSALYTAAPLGTKATALKRSIEQDPFSVSGSRPTKQPFTEQTRQARNNSRQNSVSDAPSHATSPVVHRMMSPRLPVVTSPSRDFGSVNFIPKSPHQGKSPSTNSALSESEYTILKQPATRPISEQQLINEVKGIYAGLVMVEKKCVEIVAQQASSNKRLENQQWKALVALHRTLLQEHHDFFSASQHPTASDALKKLALKYAMPARMWRHGIHAFLELLRHRLPDSMEHMLSFIYLSYSMMALLKESIPSFVETWIECLGDLARYRMAIEDSDPRDREIWSNVARTWYNEAADRSPNVGRVQHHLAVLARPNIVEQLFYYTKALTTLVPFVNARESIMLLFDMLLKNNEAMQARYPQTEAALVHAFAILFTRGSAKDFHLRKDQVANSLNAHMDRSGPKLKVQGPQMALSLIAGLLDFGKDDSPVWKCCRTQADEIATAKQKIQDKGTSTDSDDILIKQGLQVQALASLADHSEDGQSLHLDPIPQEGPIKSSEQAVALAGHLFSIVTSVMASRIGDKNVVPYMHAALANLWGLSFTPGALDRIETYVPWSKVATFLNTVGRSGISYTNTESKYFPPSFGGFGRQLIEDFFLRGYITTQCYFPPDFFTTGQMVDEDERSVELPSHQAPRAERCLWLGVQFASVGLITTVWRSFILTCAQLERYLTYDYETKQFDITEAASKLVMV